jgi:hypothetical protein
MERALDLGVGENDSDCLYKTRREETGTEPGDVKKRFEELYAVPENRIAPVLDTEDGQTERG